MTVNFRKRTKPTCQIRSHAFSLKGKDTFLYSGEVHYFRIPTRYWAKHLQALSDAGCNAVSTYVPWSWHEFEEGQMDITGRTHPERNVVGFIELARRHGLFVTLKPGPYVMAEITDQGIPRWLVQKYPDTLALDEIGRPWGTAFVSLISKTFREKSAKWLEFFARNVVLPRQSLPSGTVIMMQICNEIGMFQWLHARGDHSPSNIKAWQSFLKKHYPNLHELAQLLDRGLKNYSEVNPPYGICETRSDFVLYRIWHDFHRWLYADYTQFISRTLRNAGVSVPLFTNIGGWVFGRAHEFFLNGTFHRETTKLVPDLLYGVDHIPEFISPLNAHDAIVANQTAVQLQRRRGPLYASELQCGSREHGVQTYPNEMGLFYRHCIIHGLTAMNFYMFAQGRNPKGRGSDGPLYYWYNAVDYKGHRQPSYLMIQKLGEWLKWNGSFLIRSKRPASFAVSFYPHLYETEFIVPILGKGTKMNTAKLELSLDPIEFRNRAYFDGVLRILTQKSVPFEIADLTMLLVKDLLRYKELVVLSNEVMDATTQTKLVEFVRKGGRLIIFPMLPIYDRDFKPCQLLEKAFGCKTKGRVTSNRVYMNGLRDIPTPFNPWKIVDHNGRVLARDVNGQVIGIEKKVGKGTVRFFGFSLNYTIEEHPDLWSEMMELSQTARNAWADNDSLHVEARFHGGEGLLFVGNFHRMPMSAHIQVRNPRGGEPVNFGTLWVEGLHGLFLPIQVDIAPGLTLVLAYGELLERQATKHGASFALRGIENSQGLIVLRSRKPIRQVTVGSQPVAFTTTGGVTRAKYTQTGDKQVVDVM